MNGVNSELSIYTLYRKFDDYLGLSGGTVTGDITTEADIHSNGWICGYENGKKYYKIQNNGEFYGKKFKASENITAECVEVTGRKGGSEENKDIDYFTAILKDETLYDRDVFGEITPFRVRNNTVDFFHVEVKDKGNYTGAYSALKIQLKNKNSFFNKDFLSKDYGNVIDIVANARDIYFNSTDLFINNIVQVSGVGITFLDGSKHKPVAKIIPNYYEDDNRVFNFISTESFGLQTSNKKKNEDKTSNNNIVFNGRLNIWYSNTSVDRFENTESKRKIFEMGSDWIKSNNLIKYNKDLFEALNNGETKMQDNTLVYKKYVDDKIGTAPNSFKSYYNSSDAVRLVIGTSDNENYLTTTIEKATTKNAGVVTLGAQDFSGVKNFTQGITVNEIKTPISLNTESGLSKNILQLTSAQGFDFIWQNESSDSEGNGLVGIYDNPNPAADDNNDYPLKVFEINSQGANFSSSLSLDDIECLSINEKIIEENKAINNLSILNGVVEINSSESKFIDAVCFGGVVSFKDYITINKGLNIFDAATIELKSNGTSDDDVWAININQGTYGIKYGGSGRFSDVIVENIITFGEKDSKYSIDYSGSATFGDITVGQVTGDNYNIEYEASEYGKQATGNIQIGTLKVGKESSYDIFAPSATDTKNTVGCSQLISADMLYLVGVKNSQIPNGYAESYTNGSVYMSDSQLVTIGIRLNKISLNKSENQTEIYFYDNVSFLKTTNPMAIFFNESLNDINYGISSRNSSNVLVIGDVQTTSGKTTGSGAVEINTDCNVLGDLIVGSNGKLKVTKSSNEQYEVIDKSMVHYVTSVPVSADSYNEGDIIMVYED
jgi:hypothetical protein